MIGQSECFLHYQYKYKQDAASEEHPFIAEQYVTTRTLF